MLRIKIKDLPRSEKISKEEMKKVFGGLREDFTFYIYRPETYYTGLLLQQGPVQMDDDWNK
jgi:hypothetical protein